MYVSEMSDEKKIKLLQSAYKKGTVVRIHHMKDRILTAETFGFVSHIDDIGNMHIELEDGSNIPVNTNTDIFSVIQIV